MARPGPWRWAFLYVRDGNIDMWQLISEPGNSMATLRPPAPRR